MAEIDAEQLEVIGPFIAAFLLRLVKNFAFKLTYSLLTDKEFILRDFLVEEMWDAAAAAGVPTGTVKLIFKIIEVTLSIIDEDIKKDGSLGDDKNEKNDNMDDMGRKVLAALEEVIKEENIDLSEYGLNGDPNA